MNEDSISAELLNFLIKKYISVDQMCFCPFISNKYEADVYKKHLPLIFFWNEGNTMMISVNEVSLNEPISEILHSRGISLSNEELLNLRTNLFNELSPLFTEAVAVIIDSSHIKNIDPRNVFPTASLTIHRKWPPLKPL